MRPFDAGASGASKAIEGTADGRPGIEVIVLASSSSCSSSTSIARRFVTSSATAWRSSASIEYSATSVPANVGVRDQRDLHLEHRGAVDVDERPRVLRQVRVARRR